MAWSMPNTGIISANAADRDTPSRRIPSLRRTKAATVARTDSWPIASHVCGPDATSFAGPPSATAGPATGCIDLPADGPIDLAIVFWYFNIFERAKLVIRHCMGAGCTPNEPLSAAWLTPP